MSRRDLRLAVARRFYGDELPEAALIARPHVRVETKAIPLATACFIQEIANGATFGEAFLAGAKRSAQFDARDALALLIIDEIVVGFDSTVMPLR